MSLKCSSTFLNALNAAVPLKQLESREMLSENILIKYKTCFNRCIQIRGLGELNIVDVKTHVSLTGNILDN